MTIDYTRIITAETKSATVLNEKRAAMTCSRMQGILVLGEARWVKVLAYRDTATWTEQVIIDSASDWLRNSENIAFFAWLLELTDNEVDALFEQASALRA